MFINIIINIFNNGGSFLFYNSLKIVQFPILITSVEGDVVNIGDASRKPEYP